MDDTQTSTILQHAPAFGYSAALSSALLEFRSTISEKDADECEAVSSLSCLQHAIGRIERDQAKRDGFRNITKIRPLLQALETYSKVIEVFVNAKPDVMAFVWGPIKLCLQIAANFTRAFDALLDAYQSLGDSIPIFSAIEDLFKSNTLVQRTLVDVYKDILSFHQRSLRFFRRRGWQIALKLTYNTFEGLFGDVMDKLKRSKSLLLLSAELAQFQESKKFFEESREARMQEKDAFREQQQKEERTKLFTVIDWLQPTSQVDWHHQLQQQRQNFPDTTKWILEYLVLNRWIYSTTDERDIFWLSGIPGAGKTFLFSAIIDNIRQTRFSGFESTVASVFCKYGDPTRNSYDQIAKALISQLLKDNQNCLDYMYDVVLTSGERHASTQKQYSEILSNLILCYDHVFIGIDGLDECEPTERKLTLSLLRSLLAPSEHSSKVKILVSSCAEKDIERSIGPFRNLHLKTQHLSAAIESYVNTRLTSLNLKFKFSATKLAEIASRITKHANGMFLLARLIIDVLEDTGNREDVEEELASDILPSGINQAYERILVRLRSMKSSKNQKQAKLVLEALVAARRPLKLHEVQAVLSIRVEDSTIDLENRRYLQHLKDLCGPMVEVAADNTVDLVHLTARKYLDENHSAFLNLATAQLKLTEICISYLSFDCFSFPVTKEEITAAALRGDYGFQDYAISSWIPHVLDLTRSDEHSRLVLERCLQVWNLKLAQRYISSGNKGTSTGVEPDAETLWSDLERVEKLCSRSTSEGSSENSDTSSILKLVLTARSAIEDVIDATESPSDLEFLLECYGHCPFKCPIFGCPKYQEGFGSRQQRDLHAPSHVRKHKCPQEGCEFHEVGFHTQRMLDSHALYFHKPETLVYRFPKLKPQSDNERLQDAIEKDDSELVKKLCLGNDDVSDHFNWLKLAIRGGSQKCFIFLLELSQHKLEQDDSQGEVLGLAIGEGQSRMTSTLLKMMSSNRYYGRARQGIRYAARKSAIDVLRTVISESTLFRFDRRLWKGALLDAVEFDNNEVISLIIGNCVELSIDEDIIERIAMVIAKGGDGAKLRKLLSQYLVGSKVPEQPHPTGSKGFRTARAQGLDVLTDYIMAKASGAVDDKGKTYGNALQKAAYHGDLQKVKELIERGAEINNSDSTYGTALFAAARKSKVAVAQWLLSRGSSLRTSSQTALEAAAHGGSLEMVRMLLEAGADASEYSNFSGHDYVSWRERGSPLHTAAMHAHEEITVTLLEKGADVYATTQPRVGEAKSPWSSDSCARTALHFSVALSVWLHEKTTRRRKSSDLKELQARLVVAESLLNNGADVMAEDTNGDTPLHIFFKSTFCCVDAADLNIPLSIAKLLISRGANLGALNKKGETAKDVLSPRGFGDTLAKCFTLADVMEMIEPTPSETKPAYNLELPDLEEFLSGLQTKQSSC